MNVTINGEARSIEGAPSIVELLASLGLEPRRVAVERNKLLVHRPQYGQTRLTDGDKIEIVTLMGGG